MAKQKGMTKGKGITCVLFTETPEGTHFRKNNSTWLEHAEAQRWIDEGVAVEWNPEKGAPEHAETPTMNDTKDAILGYLVENGIEHDAENTKNELLKIIDAR